MGKRRRTEIVEIANPAARLVTYSKRRKGLFNKASELSRLCGARIAVIVFSPAGKPCSFGDPSADEIIADYLGDRDDDTMPPIGLTEWMEWVDAELDACATEEDLESLILIYEAVRDCARKQLEALEGDSQVEIGSGGPHILSEEEIDDSPDDSAAARGNMAVELTSALEVNSQVKMGSGGRPILSEEKIDFIFESLNGQGPTLAALLASPDNSAAGDGDLAVETTPAPSDLGDDGFDPDGFLSLFEDGDGDGFKTSPEDLAVSGGSSGVESAHSNVQGYDANDFAGLEELDVRL